MRLHIAIFGLFFVFFVSVFVAVTSAQAQSGTSTTGEIPLAKLPAVVQEAGRRCGESEYFLSQAGEKGALGPRSMLKFSWEVSGVERVFWESFPSGQYETILVEESEGPTAEVWLKYPSLREASAVVVRLSEAEHLATEGCLPKPQ